MSAQEVSAQKECGIPIDTFRILLNQDLDHFLKKLQKEEFTTYKGKEGIPQFILSKLACLTDGFSMADSGNPYQCCCTSSNTLPRRQLLYLDKSNDMIVITYLTGGIGVSTHILLIEFSKDERIVNFWSGLAWDKLYSRKAVIAYIKNNRDKKWGLNTNMIYF